MSRHPWIALTLSSLLLSSFLLDSSSAKDTPAQTSAPQTGRFYCDRTALSAEQRVEIRNHGRVLRDAVLRVRELEDGFEFDFKQDTAAYRALVSYIPLEHKCCPFFDFNVRVAPESGGITWKLTGAPGVKEFIKEELSWLFEAQQGR